MRMQAEDRMTAGRTNLIMTAIFFGMIITRMKMVETDKVPTMGVDGTHLFYNPKFAESLNKRELKAILAHEVLHIALLSHLRRGARDARLWNIATDFAINLLLKDFGFILPDGCLYDEKYRGWSAEKIYAHLMENPDEVPHMAREGQEAWNIGEVMPAGSMDGEGEETGKVLTKAEIKELTDKVESMVQTAAISAKKAGQLGDELEALIKDVFVAKASWKEILQRFVTERAFNDWSYDRCHTRILHSYGIISPVLQSEELGRLALIIDTSGSVDEDQLSQFAGEISDILENYQCEVTVIYIDTKINRVDEYTSEDLPLQLHAVGRGGTVQKEGYDYVAEELSDASALIAFTDSFYFDWNEIEQPSCPAFMACTSSHVASDVPDWMEVVDIS